MNTVSVIIPTHNPHGERLQRTLDGLASQTAWQRPEITLDILVIDNASSGAIATEFTLPPATRVVREDQLGLTFARRRGVEEARGELILFVDDDNVLAPDYVEQALAIAKRHPDCGAFGGKSLPRFEQDPAPWLPEFFGLLACRDLGPDEIVEPATNPPRYPAAAPIGAGMVVRRSALAIWLADPGQQAVSDRQGGRLTSGGDNELVLSILEAGWKVGYFPELMLTHLIPIGRMTADYLCRLNQGVQESWVEVLRRHDMCPWPPSSPIWLGLKTARAWFRRRTWRGDVQRIRWHGDRGRLIALSR